MKKRCWVTGVSVALLVIAGSIIAGKLGGNNVAEYTSITMDEAKEVFAAAGGYVILDVRWALALD